MIRSVLEKYKEVIAYLFWGIMTTLVSWITYSIFAALLQQYHSEFMLLGLHFSVAVFAANVLSWICAVAFAFVTNKLWVFDSRSWKAAVVLAELWKFIAARLITGVMEIVCVPLLVSIGMNQKVFGIEGLIAKIIVSVLIMVLNYVFSRLFIFKK